MRLESFRAVRPRFEAPQQDILDWLVEVHTAAARAAAATSREGDSFDGAAFQARMKRLVRHVCCGADQIAFRGYSTPRGGNGAPGCGLYESATPPAGPGTEARMTCYAREVQTVFARLYDDVPEPPADLVHVTCTGYESPSAAQRLVSSKGWGQATRVFHAYQMGCYAAVPALRVAMALARSAPEPSAGPRRVDVVHTELCSLHLDPSAHSPEQLVVQSLFADGSIRYELRPDPGEGPTRGARALRVLATHEILDEASADMMTWRLGDHGMQMGLAREVPVRLGRSIRPFVLSLYARAGLDFARDARRSVFAVHPGGPRILEVVRDALELSDPQIAAARGVLRRFGNMSSATLPHIWADLVADDAVAPGTPVASFAFGPGLTICGAVFRKE